MPTIRYTQFERQNLVAQEYESKTVAGGPSNGTKYGEIAIEYQAPGAKKGAATLFDMGLWKVGGPLANSLEEGGGKVSLSHMVFCYTTPYLLSLPDEEIRSTRWEADPVYSKHVEDYKQGVALGLVGSDGWPLFPAYAEHIINEKKALDILFRAHEEVTKAIYPAKGPQLMNVPHVDPSITTRSYINSFSRYPVYFKMNEAGEVLPHERCSFFVKVLDYEKWQTKYTCMMGDFPMKSFESSAKFSPYNMWVRLTIVMSKAYCGRGKCANIQIKVSNMFVYDYTEVGSLEDKEAAELRDSNPTHVGDLAKRLRDLQIRRDGGDLGGGGDAASMISSVNGADMMAFLNAQT
jgi:hypothetical protein